MQSPMLACGERYEKEGGSTLSERDENFLDPQGVPFISQTSPVSWMSPISQKYRGP
jgi:hypothetical protein